QQLGTQAIVISQLDHASCNTLFESGFLVHQMPTLTLKRCPWSVTFLFDLCMLGLQYAISLE
ncbi:MAG: hypothetical protein ACJAZW_003116, partial [Maritalea sp.]